MKLSTTILTLLIWTTLIGQGNSILNVVENDPNGYPAGTGFGVYENDISVQPYSIIRIENSTIGNGTVVVSFSNIGSDLTWMTVADLSGSILISKQISQTTFACAPSNSKTCNASYHIVSVVQDPDPINPDRLIFTGYYVDQSQGGTNEKHLIAGTINIATGAITSKSLSLINTAGSYLKIDGNYALIVGYELNGINYKLIVAKYDYASNTFFDKKIHSTNFKPTNYVFRDNSNILIGGIANNGSPDINYCNFSPFTANRSVAVANYDFSTMNLTNIKNWTSPQLFAMNGSYTNEPENIFANIIKSPISDNYFITTRLLNHDISPFNGSSMGILEISPSLNVLNFKNFVATSYDYLTENHSVTDIDAQGNICIAFESFDYNTTPAFSYSRGLGLAKIDPNNPFQTMQVIRRVEPLGPSSVSGNNNYNKVSLDVYEDNFYNAMGVPRAKVNSSDKNFVILNQYYFGTTDQDCNEYYEGEFFEVCYLEMGMGVDEIGSNIGQSTPLQYTANLNFMLDEECYSSIVPLQNYSSSQYGTNSFSMERRSENSFELIVDEETEKSTYEVIVYNMLGSMVYTSPIINKGDRLNLSNLKPGIYIIRTTNIETNEVNTDKVLIG